MELINSAAFFLCGRTRSLEYLLLTIVIANRPARSAFPESRQDLRSPVQGDARRWHKILDLWNPEDAPSSLEDPEHSTARADESTTVDVVEPR